LTAPQPLDPAQFLAAQVYDASSTDPWYPVYIQSVSAAVAPQSSLTGACAGSNQATRTGEGVQINFLPQSYQNNSPVPGPGDPTDPSGSTPAWNILIGFVKWDGISNFTDAGPANQNKVKRQLSGVQAARVEGYDGSLDLQTSTAGQRLVVVLQEASTSAPGSMTFGPVDTSGNVTPALRVTASGDLTIQGNFASGSPLGTGNVRIQSGIATDGMTLPLPPGLTDAQVQSGSVLLHYQVTSIVPDLTVPAIGGTNVLAVTPLACYVDSSRRVRCRLRYLFSGSSITASDVAGTCRYTVVAAGAAGGTSS